ncbi:hypothetical protein BDF21DRAFT_423196 [Thamnidium elegans]|nr:hypothetical protein BDF21DRAFT_423196 [Thamnidium elegans]
MTPVSPLFETIFFFCYTSKGICICVFFLVLYYRSYFPPFLSVNGVFFSTRL